METLSAAWLGPGWSASYDTDSGAGKESPRERAGAGQRCGPLDTSRRAYQQWETGDRGMQPAFWEVLKIKTAFIAHKP